jgi:hypothetical protein
MRMSSPLVIEGTLAPSRRGRADRQDEHNDGPASAASVSASRVPRIARLVALAWHIDGLVQSGTLPSYAAAARLGHVSRARLSQIVSLLNLAPDVQEQLLFLRQPTRGRQPLTLRQVLRVAAALDWSEQRRRWRQLRRARKERAPAVAATP